MREKFKSGGTKCAHLKEKCSFNVVLCQPRIHKRIDWTLDLS